MLKKFIELVGNDETKIIKSFNDLRIRELILSLNKIATNIPDGDFKQNVIMKNITTLENKYNGIHDDTYNSIVTVENSNENKKENENNIENIVDNFMNIIPSEFRSEIMSGYDNNLTIYLGRDKLICFVDFGNEIKLEHINIYKFRTLINNYVYNSGVKELPYIALKNNIYYFFTNNNLECYLDPSYKIINLNDIKKYDMNKKTNKKMNVLYYLFSNNTKIKNMIYFINYFLKNITFLNNVNFDSEYKRDNYGIDVNSISKTNFTGKRNISRKISYNIDFNNTLITDPKKFSAWLDSDDIQAMEKIHNNLIKIIPSLNYNNDFKNCSFKIISYSNNFHRIKNENNGIDKHPFHRKNDNTINDIIDTDEIMIILFKHFFYAKNNIDQNLLFFINDDIESLNKSQYIDKKITSKEESKYDINIENNDANIENNEYWEKKYFLKKNNDINLISDLKKKINNIINEIKIKLNKEYFQKYQDVMTKNNNENYMTYLNIVTKYHKNTYNNINKTNSFLLYAINLYSNYIFDNFDILKIDIKYQNIIKQNKNKINLFIKMSNYDIIIKIIQTFLIQHQMGLQQGDILGFKFNIKYKQKLIKDNHSQLYSQIDLLYDEFGKVVNDLFLNKLRNINGETIDDVDEKNKIINDYIANEIFGIDKKHVSVNTLHTYDIQDVYKKIISVYQNNYTLSDIDTYSIRKMMDYENEMAMFDDYCKYMLNLKIFIDDYIEKGFQSSVVSETSQYPVVSIDLINSLISDININDKLVNPVVKQISPSPKTSNEFETSKMSKTSDKLEIIHYEKSIMMEYDDEDDIQTPNDKNAIIESEKNVSIARKYLLGNKKLLSLISFFKNNSYNITYEDVHCIYVKLFDFLKLNNVKKHGEKKIIHDENSIHEELLNILKSKLTSEIDNNEMTINEMLNNENNKNEYLNDDNFILKNFISFTKFYDNFLQNSNNLKKSFDQIKNKNQDKYTEKHIDFEDYINHIKYYLYIHKNNNDSKYFYLFKNIVMKNMLSLDSICLDVLFNFTNIKIFLLKYLRHDILHYIDEQDLIHICKEKLMSLNNLDPNKLDDILLPYGYVKKSVDQKFLILYQLKILRHIFEAIDYYNKIEKNINFPDKLQKILDKILKLCCKDIKDIIKNKNIFILRNDIIKYINEKIKFLDDIFINYLLYISGKNINISIKKSNRDDLNVVELIESFVDTK